MGALRGSQTLTQRTMSDSSRDLRAESIPEDLGEPGAMAHYESIPHHRATDHYQNLPKQRIPPPLPGEEPGRNNQTSDSTQYENLPNQRQGLLLDMTVNRAGSVEGLDDDEHGYENLKHIQASTGEAGSSKITSLTLQGRASPLTLRREATPTAVYQNVQEMASKEPSGPATKPGKTASKRSRSRFISEQASTETVPRNQQEGVHHGQDTLESAERQHGCPSAHSLYESLPSSPMPTSDLVEVTDGYSPEPEYENAAAFVPLAGDRQDDASLIRTLASTLADLSMSESETASLTCSLFSAADSLGADDSDAEARFVGRIASTLAGTDDNSSISRSLSIASESIKQEDEEDNTDYEDPASIQLPLASNDAKNPAKP